MKKYVPSGYQIIAIQTEVSAAVTDFTTSDDMKLLKEWMDKAVKGIIQKPLLLTILDETNHRIVSGIASYYIEPSSDVLCINLQNIMDDSSLLNLQLFYNASTETLGISYITALA